MKPRSLLSLISLTTLYSIHSAHAQLPLTESFESLPSATTYTLTTAFDDGGFDFFNRFAVPDTANGARDDFPNGWTGSFGIFSQDNDGDGGSPVGIVTIPNVDITGQTDLTVTLSLAALNSAPSFNNYEAAENDGIKIYATIDAGVRTLIGQFAPLGAANDLFVDTDLDGEGDGVRLTTDLDDFSFAIPGTGNSLILEVELTSTGSFEPIALDNVRITSGGQSQVVLQGGALITPIANGDTTPNPADGTNFDGGGRQTYTITNTGSAALSVSAINITGANAAEFAVENFTAGSVAPGASLTFDIALSAATSGDKFATVEVVSDGPEASYSFNIQAIGSVAGAPPVFTQTGPFSVSDQAPAGIVVGDVNSDNDGQIDVGVTYSIAGISAGGPSMMAAESGYITKPLHTIGDTVGSYVPPGVLDGLGAYELDANTVRILANHELLNFRGYAYDVSDGAGGTYQLTGARVSYFDIDKTTRQVVASDLAYNTIYDANGNIATDTSFLTGTAPGFTRFCSSSLFEAKQFGGLRGLEDRIYFTGEETGSVFDAFGGAEWALDLATGDFWHVPAMGRGAWENVTEIDTGTTTHVAFLLADDSSPFNADADAANEAAPLYLYVGEKNPAGDFLERNGLRDGTLYVWVADNGDTLPSQFNTSGSRTGQWVAIESGTQTGGLDNTPSQDGSTGFDKFGYPTQSTLWTRAEAAGAFGFSRPEDLAVNPNDGTEAVLASTGVDTYDVVNGNGSDTFGTLYTIKTVFDANAVPTSVTVSILYDGDADSSRALRSPDNLDWADDGLIYVQEDEAEEDTLTGEVLFGTGAANPNEAGIVIVDPSDGAVTRIANIDRSVILDPTTTGTPFDTDAGLAGEWESSGILDVSTLFGENPGTLFVFDVQAHGIEDQTGTNADSRINDSDLVEGGQLLFLQKVDGGLFKINPNTGVVTLAPGAELDSSVVSQYEIKVLADDGGVAPVEATVTVNVNNDPVAISNDIKVASYNTSMNRPSEGALVTDLSDLLDTQIQQIAEVIQINRPDVVLINEFDFDAGGVGAKLFRENYLEVPQDGEQPIYYPYVYNAPSNTGVPSGLDFDNSGTVGGGGDAFGFGNFPGQFGMLVLSRFPIDEDAVRTFQTFLWKDMPGNLIPNGIPAGDFFTTAELDAYRLSSKSHWDVPVNVNGNTVHILASHPTPPVFDDGTDRDLDGLNDSDNLTPIFDLNGRRNSDEIRFWSDYVTPGKGAYIYDDNGNFGGLELNDRFVVLGDQNADPDDGDSSGPAISQLLGNSFVDASFTPESDGADEVVPVSFTNRRTKTSSFNLRADYALPSVAGFSSASGSVFWPSSTQPNADLTTGSNPSDHRMVLLDLTVDTAAPVLPDSTITDIGDIVLGLGAEIAAFDPASNSAFVTSGDGLQIVDLADPTSPLSTTVITPLTNGGPTNEITSTDVGSGPTAGVVAIAVVGVNTEDSGQVQFYEIGTNTFLGSVAVGPNPDQIVFTPDGTKLLVANEGESAGPENEPLITPNPEGSVSIIDLTNGVASAAETKATFTSFNGQEAVLRAAGVRIFPGVAAATDFEPEGIAITVDSQTAFVTLQENNAVARLDIATATFTDILPLGVKDHSLAGNMLDASNRDSGINIQNWPIVGLYMPDAIATYEVNGKTFFVIANEGDGRDVDETRVAGLTLDPTAYPDAATLQLEENLGRIKASNIDGDTDGDNDIDLIHVFGGRSFSIYSEDGTQVYDSGDEFEKITAAFGLPFFNDDDGRSDDKGPEPEGLTIGRIGGRTLAFIGLERTGGVMVYDITDPEWPFFVSYEPLFDSSRPEGLEFVSAVDSPNGKNLLLVTNESSNNLDILTIDLPFTLQMLHASDLEGGLDAIGNAPNFAAIVDDLEQDAALKGYASVLLSAGDNYIPGPFFGASGDRSLRTPLQQCYQNIFGESGLTNIREGDGRVDITIMNILGFDASAVGNHEFDAGTSTFAGLLETDIRGLNLSDARWLGTQFPYLSANLDFSTDSNFNGLFTTSILPNTDFASTPDDLTAAGNAPKVAPATVLTIGGERIGVVGATTQLLEFISSSGNVTQLAGNTNDMAALAAVLQPVIDNIIDGDDNTANTSDDINKVILVSHLQQIALEKQLAGLLSGVDLIVAGGSDTLQADSSDILRTGDTAAEGYPFLTTNADSDPVAIVSTAGEYSYIGRLVVEFDSAGKVLTNTIDSAVSGAYASDEAGVLRTTGATDLTTAIADSSKATDVKKLTDAVTNVINTQDGVILGRTKVYLDGRRTTVRTQESNLGNLTADANLVIAKEFDPTVQVSIKNGGGIRNPIGIVNSSGAFVPPPANPAAGKQEGDISQLDISNALRFNNELTLLTLTAEELKAVLEHGVAASAPGNTPGQFFQLGGIHLSVDLSGSAISFNPDGSVATPGTRIRNAAIVDENGFITDVLVRDGILAGDINREIRVVTLDFLWGRFSPPTSPFGGDGYPFKGYGDNVVQLGDVLTADGSATFANAGSEQDALAEYLLANFATDPFCEAETAPADDIRIQFLGARSDDVLGQTLTDFLAGGESAASQGDEFEPLFEYAFGLDLNGVDGSLSFNQDGSVANRGGIISQIVRERDAFDFRATFLRRKNANAVGLTYTVEFSSDLVSWEASNDKPIFLEDDGEVEAVYVPYPFFLTDGTKPQFFRVIVTQN